MTVRRSPRPFWAHLKTPLRVLIGVGALVLILSRVSIPSIVAHLSEVLWSFVLANLLIEIVVHGIASLKWYLLLRVRDQRVRFFQVVAAQFMGISLGSLLPIVGGILSVGYIYYLQSGRAATAISSIATDRVLSQYVAVLLAGSVLVVNLDGFRGKPEIVLLTGITFLTAVFLPFGLYALTRIPGFHDFRWIPGRFKELFQSIIGDFQIYQREGRHILFYNLALSLGIQLLRVLSVSLTLAVGLSPSFRNYAVMAPIMLLFILLPIPVARLGWEQGIFIVMLGLIGVSADRAVTMALVNRLVLTIIFIPGILCMLSGWGLKKSSFFRHIQTKPHIKA